MSPLSPDGALRLQYHQLTAVTLVHLISGIDEGVPLLAPDAASPTKITGFTEWVNQAEGGGKAKLTLGWDFQLHVDGARPTLARLGPPRSNIALLDEQLAELGHDAADALLSQFVDTLAWQDVTLNAMTLRYQK